MQVRWMVTLLLLLVASGAGCGDDRSPHADAKPIDAAPDAPYSCAASQSCVDGPACGTTCCGIGEHCANGTCMCGNEPSCTGGDMCQGAGVTAQPCGSVCCGVTISCPI